MELQVAAKELGISSRHLHRLIRLNALPAKKVVVEQVVTKEVWDIDDEAIQSAKLVIEDMNPDHFGRWAFKWIEKLDIPAEKLAQMTKIKKEKLFLILQRPGYTTDEYDGLTEGDPTIPIVGAIMREYLRQRTQKEDKPDSEG